MPQLNRQTVLFIFGMLAVFTIQSKAQSEHTLCQQSQMKSEAQLSPEEQRIIELDRIDYLSHLMANDEARIETEARTGKVARKAWNLSVGLRISENEANLIRVTMHQVYLRLTAIRTREVSESLQGLSLEEREDRSRRIQEEKYRVCEEATKLLKEQLGDADFEKFDAMLRADFPWHPPDSPKPPRSH